MFYRVLLNGIKKIPQKVCPSGVQTGAKCERKVLAYKKNIPGLISIIHIKNSKRIVLPGLN